MRRPTDPPQGPTRAQGRPSPKRSGTAAIFVGLFAASLALAETPVITCQSMSVGGRVLVDPTLRDFLDRDLQRLIRLGLVGRLHLEVELIRHRRLWFDERVDHRDLDVALSWSSGGQGFRLQGVPVADVSAISVERLALRHGDSDSPTDLEVHVSARLEVVTAKSLDAVATWMTGSRDGIPANVLKAIANDLERRGSGDCAVAQP